MRDNLAALIKDRALTTYKRRLRTDPDLRKLGAATRGADAAYRDAAAFAIRAGELAGESLQTVLAAGADEDWLDVDQAGAIMDPVLQELWRQASAAAARVQTGLNRAAGFGLSGLVPPLNLRRAQNMAKKLASYASYDEASWMLGEPIVTYAQNVVDDCVRVNAAAQSMAGLSPIIERLTDNEDCAWCAQHAGRFGYPSPPGVFERHRKCRCLVQLVTVKSARPDAETTRLYREAEAAQRARRIERINKELYRINGKGPDRTADADLYDDPALSQEPV